MSLTTLFSRAWQQKYLTPAERAVYKFVVALIVLIPSSLLLGGADAALTWLHANVPPLVWAVLAVLIPALLMAFAKYATARGDTVVGSIIQQVEQEAEKDLTPANPNPVRIPTALPLANVPPRAIAQDQPKPPTGA